MSDDFYCPICSELMFDPVVVAPCGHSFDRGCVENWFKTNSQRSCPSCRGEVQGVFPIITLKNLVHEHAKNNSISIPEPPPRERPVPSAPPSVSPVIPSAPTPSSAVDVPSFNNLNQDLLNAAKNGDLQQLEFYIAAGADVNAKDNYNETPLHHAALKGSPECVRLLLTAGATVDAKNNDNKTPLHWAAHKGSPECVQLLLAAGACVEAKNNNNNSTPLHEAAICGSPECVSLLLAAGACVNAKNNNNRTPLDLAERYNHAACVALLAPPANRF